MEKKDRDTNTHSQTENQQANLMYMRLDLGEEIAELDVCREQ